MRRGPFLLLFAVSGAAALIYEVVWTRLLTLQMGHSLAAASTVLAAFMGGLAAGAAAAGRAGGRLSPVRALHIYAALEGGIAATALLLPASLALVRPLLAAAYAEGAGGAGFAALRLASSLVLVAAPAAAMGATFPIAARWAVRDIARAARDAGHLYAANTIGAAAGALAAGFWLIEALGLRGTTLVGVALNAVASGGALVLARTAAPVARASEAPAGEVPPALPARRAARRHAGRTPRPWLAAGALAASGFASLALQVVWTRLLALVLGPTTYAFSLVVSLFIIGLAGGAAFGARAASRARQPVTGLALSLAASGALGAFAASSVDQALVWMAYVVAQPGATFDGVLIRQVMLVTALLLPMTLAFGAAFPFAVAVASVPGPGDARDEGVVENLGRIYAINTVGAIAGALLAGFLLVPQMGLHGTIRLVVALSALAAAAVASQSHGRTRTLTATVAAAVLAVAIWLPGWDRLLLSSGAYKYAAAIRGPSLEAALSAGDLLWYREGATGTVSVRRLGGTLSLAIDGKVDASNAGDMLTQRLLAHVPLLLHPAPRRAAILGLGSGVTLGSALTHPLDRVVALEISPEVVAASRYFDVQSHRATEDPRTTLIIGDGRAHLMYSGEQYDVIVSEPSNPWMAGIATLFTREFFEAAKARLAPGGLLCQWAHTYDISADDLRSIVATFLSVFPDGTLWLVGDADVLLVGSTASTDSFPAAPPPRAALPARPVDDRIALIADAWKRPGVADDLASVGARTPFAVISLYVAGGATLRSWAAGATLQRDDRPALEFSGPRSIFGLARDDNAAALRALAASAPRPRAVEAALAEAGPVDWRVRGAMLLGAEAYRPAYDDFARVLQQDPDDELALDGLIRAAVPAARISEARALLTRLASAPGRTPAKLALSRLLASLGAVDEAARIPLTLLATDPRNVPALEQLASVLADAGDAERLAPVVARLAAEAPSRAWTHYYTGSLYFLQKRFDRALREARLAVAIEPTHGKAHNLIGACLASLGQAVEARAAFEASLQADPREPGTYANLATLELQLGNRDRARRYFAEALTIDPDSTVARQGLAALNGR